MVISAQARRNWKIAAIVCSVGTGIQAVLFTDYNIPGDDPHVFSSLQAAWKDFVRTKLYGMTDASNETSSRDEASKK